MLLQRQPPIKITTQPVARSLALPIDGMFRGGALPPCPSGLAPEFLLAVALRFHKLGEFALRHCGARDGKGTHFDGMRPLFVVENKRLLARPSQQKLPARNFRIAPIARIADERSSFARTRCLQSGKNGRAPPMSLTCVRESLRVHVLVEHAQRNEIAIALGQ